MKQFNTMFLIQTSKVLRYSSIFICLMMMAYSANAQPFTKDVHYTEMSSSASTSENQLVEYFSFSCPGCYALEPILKQVLKNRSEFELQRVHMPFGGRHAKFSQKVFVLLKQLDAEKYKEKVFSRIHQQSNPFNSDAEIIEFFVSLGYEQKNVEKRLHSFSTNTMIRTMNKQGADNKIHSVPSVVVNGKYLITLNKLNSAEELASLIDYLNTLTE